MQLLGVYQFLTSKKTQELVFQVTDVIRIHKLLSVGWNKVSCTLIVFTGCE